MTVTRSSIKHFVFGLTAILLFLLYWKNLTLLPLAHAAPSRPPVSAEMERLAKFYVGTWDYTETYDKAPSDAAAGKNTGIYTSEPGPGGNSIVNRFHSHGPAGDFEGLLMITWDPRENAYKAYLFGADFPGAFVETGQFEGDTFVLRGELSMGKTTIALRSTNRVGADGKMISEAFRSVNGAPESRLVQVISARRP